MQETACNEGDVSSIPGPGRYPAGGNGNPLQYSFLGNPMDRGTWRATVHGVAESQTWLSDWTTTNIWNPKTITDQMLHLSAQTQGSPRVPTGQVLQAGPTAPQELLPQQVTQLSWRIRRVRELPLSRTGASLSSCGCCLGCAAGPPQKSLPFPSLGDLPDSRIEPRSPVSPTLQIDSLPNEP